jgi:transposase
MQRKVFSAEFKAKVAMEALTGRKTINEIAGTHEVHPNQVTSWKREAQEGIPMRCTARLVGCKCKWSG